MPRSDANFIPLFPTPTAGDGKVRPNSARTGSGQGKGSPHRRGHCAQCGMVNDFAAIDTEGGSDDGNGARGAITETDETGTLLNGETFTETYGVETTKKGGGCALCSSKNARGLK